MKPFIFIGIFIVLFFGKIIHNGFQHKKHLAAFEIKCEAQGGVMHVPKGARGWPRPECRNPNAFIKIEPSA